MKRFCYFLYLLPGFLMIPMLLWANSGWGTFRFVDLPYSQSFDNVNPPAMPTDWNAINTSGISNSFVGTTSSVYHSAPNCAMLSNSTDLNSAMMLVLPSITDEMIIAHTELRFWASSNLNEQRLEVGFVESPQAPESFVLYQRLEGISNTWEQYKVRFLNYHGANRYLAIRHPVSAFNRQLFIDDLVWEDAEVHDLGVVSIYGNPTPSIAVPSVYQIMIRNYGLVPQAQYQVKYYRGNNVEIASVDGEQIGALETQVLSMVWTPQNLGNEIVYAKVILDGDQNPANDECIPISVSVQEDGGYQVIPPYDPVMSRIPIDVNWKNSLFECIFLASDLYSVSGVISEMKLWNSFVDMVPQKPIKIWLGMTPNVNLSAGMIPAGDLSLVYDGIMDIPIGQNEIQIVFDSGFSYLNSLNLVMMIQAGFTEEYYGVNNNFHTRTATGIRSRRVSGNTTIYDPYNPPTVTTGLPQMPVVSFKFDPLSLGAFHGVVRGTSNQALEGVRIEVLPQNTVIYSDRDGFFSLCDLIPGTYQLSYSIAWYQLGTQSIEVIGDQTLALSYNMIEYGEATVSGRIVSVDNSDGIVNIMIRLDGPQTYSCGTDSEGYFMLNGVYSGHLYTYGIHSQGYQYQSGAFILGEGGYDFGIVNLESTPYAPLNVLADWTSTMVNVHWSAPDPFANGILQSFEDEDFPSDGWLRYITNIGAANAYGVYPTWDKIAEVNYGITHIIPTHGSFQAGLWWSYNHQDEWLISPPISCPSNAYLRFDTYAYYGSAEGDHYYVKISLDGGLNWNVLWDASALAGGWNYYDEPVWIDLRAYEGMEIMLAWHADDPPTNDGLRYQWFIDKVSIFSPEQVPGMLFGNSKQRETNRALQGYRVYRLQNGQEDNPQDWSLLTPQSIQSNSYADMGFASLPIGIGYRYAVLAIYENDMISPPTFSNTIIIPIYYGYVAGVVRNTNNEPISGAVVSSVINQSTTNNAGAYFLVLPQGMWDITVSKEGYISQTLSSIIIQGTTITLNFILNSSASDDSADLNIPTLLKNSSPNPFYNSTNINYSVKDKEPVEIAIYNIRGQRVKSYYHKPLGAGEYRFEWDGKTDGNRLLAAGLYFCVMKSANYHKSLKIIKIH